MEKTIYDLAIVGGGPAGAAAAVYAARKRLKTILILKEWGGQSIVSEDIQNWIGTSHISGVDLAKNLEKHVKEYEGEILKIKESLLATKLDSLQVDSQEYIQVTLENAEKILVKSLLITTGSNRRKLTIPGAAEFENKGLTYCASCDGPMFADKHVVVIGGGNAGFESAAQLLAYCSSVTLLARSGVRADKIAVEKLSQNPKFKLYTNTKIKEVHGETLVNALSFLDENDKEIKLNVSGIFVEVGQIPSTAWTENLLELDKDKKIQIDPWTGKASPQYPIWAAGDCTNILYQQNNIAAGEAVKAVEDIYKTLSIT